MTRNRPVLIKGGAALWNATKTWSDEYIRRAVGSITVNVERSRNRRYGQEEQSWYRSSQLDEEAFTWKRFLELYRKPEPPHHYAQGEIPKALFQDVEAPGVAPCMYKWLVWMVLWVGRGGENSLLHNDQYENLYAIVDGTKKVTLIDGMQAAYVYEDKYLSDAGKVSSVDIEQPDYGSHPWLRHATYTEVTVKKGDILYIPIYWWHQVRSQERTIGVTMWFDPWGLPDVAGSGRGRRTDLNLAIIKAWVGRRREAPTCNATPQDWMAACRAVGEICRQNAVAHNFCASRSASRSLPNEELVEALRRLGVTDKGDPRTQEEFRAEGDRIREGWGRAEINAAMGEVVSCGEVNHVGLGSDQVNQEAKVVDAVANRLYFENPAFLDQVHAAGRDGNAKALQALLRGFNAAEAHRILHQLFMDPAGDPGGAMVARLLVAALPA